ncbi:MAG: lysozyme inhibitor LprI family protein [Thiolinea sp.]
MKAFTLASLLFLLSTCLLADDGGIHCNLAGNQMEMNQCALDDFTAADQQLNATWKVLLTKYREDRAFLDKIKAAQRAWISFRDAEVAAQFACEDADVRLCWGSMYPMLYHGEMTRLTRERTQRLQEYIDQGYNSTVGE